MTAALKSNYLNVLIALYNIFHLVFGMLKVISNQCLRIGIARRSIVSFTRISIAHLKIKSCFRFGG
ncbi:hypothetical protein ES708_15715 [subsurface metagenome]